MKTTKTYLYTSFSFDSIFHDGQRNIIINMIGMSKYANIQNLMQKCVISG